MASWSLNKFLNLFLTLFAINFAPAISSPIVKNFIQLEAPDDGSALDFLNGIKKFYLPINTNNSNCNIAVEHFLPSIATETVDSWALRMADSWGKIPDGIIFGNIRVLGMYEECLKIQGSVTPLLNNSKISFQGKYCKIHYRYGLTETVELENRSRISILPFPISYATCIPSVCSDEDFMVSLNQTLNEIGRKLESLDCHEEGRSNHAKFDGFDAFVCSLLGLLALLVVIGTIIDENNLKHYETTPGRKLILEKLRCFSATKSFKSTFKYRRNNERSITCLHGIRVIAMIWIMICHQGVNDLKFAINNTHVFKFQSEKYIAQLLFNAYQVAEIFFCISGIVLSYRLFPAILEGKDLSAKIFLKKFTFSLLRRIVRLLPSIFTVATFTSTIIRFLGFGPRSSVLDELSQKCRKYWWKDPLFVDNLIHDDDVKIITKSDCLHHCWYTSIEMQLFLIVPFVFLPRIYNKLNGFLWLFFLTLMSQIIPLIIMIINEFPPIPFPYTAVQENYEYFSKYYEVPWCRSAPWFIGIWTGIILVKYPHKLKRLTKVQVVIGYVVVTIFFILLMFGLYRYNHVEKSRHQSEMPTWLAAIYGFFSKPILAFCVSWVVVTCHKNQAWYVNAVLSWWGWQPLSRLTFCMYLVGPVVQIWWASTLYVPIYITYMSEAFRFSGAFFLNFIIAFFLSILVEQPFLRLTNNIRSTTGLATLKQHSRQKK
ncbi:UNVERIFIED_CONTAM: hypothetical protein RMT77_002208 [Armadillidium vulgare]